MPAKTTNPKLAALMEKYTLTHIESLLHDSPEGCARLELMSRDGVDLRECRPRKARSRAATASS